MLALALLAALHGQQRVPNRPKLLAFTISQGPADDASIKSDLYVCDLSGNHVRLIAKNILEWVSDGGGMAPQSPGDSYAWSPSGSRLYFTQRHGDNDQLFEWDKADGHSRRIAPQRKNIEPVEWLNDQEVIVSFDNGGRDFAVDVLTGQMRRHGKRQTSYSPNHRYKLYYHTLAGGDDVDMLDTITHKRTTISKELSGGFMDVWSPNSDFVCANWGLDPDGGLAVINTSTGKRHVSDDGMVDDIFWSPDSRSVAWTNDDGVIVYDTKEGKEKNLGSPNSDLFGWTCDSNDLVLTSPDQKESPLIILPVSGGRKRVLLKRRNLTSVRVAGYERFADDNGGE